RWPISSLVEYCYRRIYFRFIDTHTKRQSMSCWFFGDIYFVALSCLVDRHKKSRSSFKKSGRDFSFGRIIIFNNSCYRIDRWAGWWGCRNERKLFKEPVKKLLRGDFGPRILLF